MKKTKVVLVYNPRVDSYKVLELVDRVTPQVGTLLKKSEVEQLIEQTKNTVVIKQEKPL